MTRAARVQPAELLKRKLHWPENVVLPHAPHPKQFAALLLSSVYREVLFGGAVGGGKSDAALMAAAQYVDVPGYSALILRRTYASLTLAEGLIPRAREWFEWQKGVKWNSETKSLEFETYDKRKPALITFGYIRNEQDRMRYQSTAWNTVVWEEASEFATDEHFRFIQSRQRRPKVGPLSLVPTRNILTSNPVGPGVDWIRRRFIVENDDADSRRIFLPSTLDDNPSIDAEDYEIGLKELPPLLYKRLRWGDWSEMGLGELFPKHRWKWCTPGQVPRLRKVVRHWDLAGTEPSPSNPDPDYTAGVKLGVAENGRVYVLSVKRDRQAPDGVQRLVNLTSKGDGKASPVRINQDPGQAGKAQILTYVRMLAGYDVAGVSESGDVVTRCAPFSAQQRAGNVTIVDDGGGWQGDFVDELDAFPYGTHDDQAVAAAMAYSDLHEIKGKRRRKAHRNVRLFGG